MLQRVWLCLLLGVSPLSIAEWHYREAEIFGTSVTIQLWSEKQAHGEQLVESAIDELWRIHNAFSPYLETSELSQLNLNAINHHSVVSSELSELIIRAQHVSRMTDGAFDITFASVGYAYNYREGIQPSQETIASLLQGVNFRHIDVAPETREVKYLDPRVKIDLGGIAKGYAVERVIQMLRQQGVRHASVSAGGDSRLLGDKRGQPWIVGIRDPRGEGSVIRLPLTDVAISTSGDYERFFISETGERVHHIINPSTGKSTSEVISVTVLGPSATDTDPLSTSVFVLGVEKGMQLIENLLNFDAIIIDKQGKVHYSSGLQEPE